MLKIQLTAIMPMNTAHPIVRIMALPNFFVLIDADMLLDDLILL